MMSNILLDSSKGKRHTQRNLLQKVSNRRLVVVLLLLLQGTEKDEDDKWANRRISEEVKRSAYLGEYTEGIMWSEHPEATSEGLKV